MEDSWIDIFDLPCFDGFYVLDGKALSFENQANETNDGWSDIIKVPKEVTSFENGLFKDMGTIEKVVFWGEVLEIPDECFSGMENLKEIILPDSIKSIGCKAFAGCKSLTKIALPQEVKKINSGTFADCTSLEDVTLSENVEEIDDCAFYNCPKLKEINLLPNLRYIGEEAFYNCITLNKITINKSANDISPTCFKGCNHFTHIDVEEGNKLFKSGNDLNYLLNIQNNSLCVGPANGAIPQCKIIGDGSFMNYKFDNDLVLPDSVEVLEKECFYGSSIKKLTLPSSINQIDDSALACANIISIHIENNDFYYSIGDKFLLEKRTQKLIYACPNKIINLPNEITTIGPYCFSNIDAEEVYLKDGVKNIENYCFNNLFKTKKIHLPNSIETISKDAFINCQCEIIYDGTYEQWKKVKQDITYSKSHCKSLLCLDKDIFAENYF